MKENTNIKHGTPQRRGSDRLVCGVTCDGPHKHMLERQLRSNREICGAAAVASIESLSHMNLVNIVGTTAFG